MAIWDNRVFAVVEAMVVSIECICMGVVALYAALNKAPGCPFLWGYTILKHRMCSRKQ